MDENSYNDEVTSTNEEIVKGITKTVKKVVGTSDSYSSEDNGNTSYNYNSTDSGSTSDNVSSTFKVAGANLPVKPSVWTKIKNVLFAEIRVELTPYQQKIEDEINDYLHQEITWKSLKEAALSEVPITFMGKRIF